MRCGPSDASPTSFNYVIQLRLVLLRDTMVGLHHNFGDLLGMDNSQLRSCVSANKQFCIVAFCKRTLVGGHFQGPLVCRKVGRMYFILKIHITSEVPDIELPCRSMSLSPQNSSPHLKPSQQQFFIREYLTSSVGLISVEQGNIEEPTFLIRKGLNISSAVLRSGG